MTTRDEAARHAATKAIIERYPSFDLLSAAAISEAIGDAGLLRPGPTGEDRETATFTLAEIDAAIRADWSCPHDNPTDQAGCMWQGHGEQIITDLHARLTGGGDEDAEPTEVDRLRAVVASVQALHDRLAQERPYSMGGDYVRLLREALAPRPRDPGTESHEFLPVADHPDDDECTYRSDGTDATYCGEPASAHDVTAGFVRPRGPVTEEPAVTAEQIESAAAAIYEIDPLPRCGDGSWAALLSAGLEGTMSGAIAASIADDRRASARAALAAALGIEVRGGDPA